MAAAAKIRCVRRKISRLAFANRRIDNFPQTTFRYLHPTTTVKMVRPEAPLSGRMLTNVTVEHRPSQDQGPLGKEQGRLEEAAR